MKIALQRSPRGLSELLRRHPYLFTFLICAVLLPFGFADRALITAGSCVYLGVVAAAAAVAAVFLFKLGKTLYESIILCVICVSGITACMMIIALVQNKTLAISIIALIVAVTAALFIKATFGISDTAIIALLIFLGITIRFVYVLYTGSIDRQHDVGFFNWNWGHANYIEYWYNNPFKLPDFDIRTKWQYYHPPLHHWLMAVLLRLLTWLGVKYETAAESLQMLPMLYSCLTVIVSYRIFRLVKLKGKPLFAAVAIMCFHPTFILFAGSFNNDMLLTLFVMAAIMWGLRWYRVPKMKNIIPLALCIGLGMMTKLSGWMVAPAVAALFLIVLIKNIRKPIYTIVQYTVFLIISVPLGIWWQVRNLLRFNVPLTYIQGLGTEVTFYLGNMSVTERLFDFSGQQLTYIYDAFLSYGAPYDEYNPTLGLFKTAMFDEGTNNICDANFPQISVTAPILYILSIVLFLVCFVCFICAVVRKSKYINCGAERLYFALLFAVYLGCYYWFCFAYPYTCTMNIRYCMPLIPLCAMGLALVLQSTKDNKKPVAVWFRRVMYAVTAAFCAMSYLVYTQVGMTQ